MGKGQTFMFNELKLANRSLLIILSITVCPFSFRLSKKPKKPQRRQNNRLKPLTLAYDGDADM